MSVKIKMIFGFVIILLMVCVQSFLIVNMNNKRDEISQQALVTFQYNLVIKDRLIDVKTLEIDLLFKILNSEAITEDKLGMVSTNSSGISLYLLQWYDAFTTSPEYKHMNDALKQKVSDMKPLFDDIRNCLVEIRSMQTRDQKKRLQVYIDKMKQPITQYTALATDFVGQNSQFYSVTNKSLAAYSRDMARNQAITIGVAILFIIFIIFYSQYVLTPLNWLMEGIASISQGNMNYRVRKRSNDELGRLAVQFNSMNDEIKNHREHLEELVQKRTAQLIEAKEELEKTNENLTTTNHSLEEAHRIADLDMKMAVNVQSAFFMKRPPKTKEWEIAFAFLPMAGVAGDMYDFYIDPNGNLQGVAMMDVSGHGIASGLITMIAKSVIFRNFHSHTDEKLSKVVEVINDDLITELGNVDNYLTGIILRFKDNMVEYVNAGHTELMRKRGSSGEVSIVAPEDNRSFKGYFLGLEAMKMPFSQLMFEVKKDDTLLIFSDCLNESVNKDGEEFGLQQVQQVFNDAPTDNVNDTVRYIVDKLYDFTGTRELNDDLTIIALKRLL